MKYSFLFILLSGSALLPLMAQNASSDDLPKNCLKTNLLSPVFSSLNLAVETRASGDYSFQIGFAYMNHATYALSDGLTKAIFLTPEIRYELASTRGGYSFVSAFARYINMEYSQTEKSNGKSKRSVGEYQSVGLGVMIGQKFIYKNRVAFELFAGPVYSGLISSRNDFYNRASDDLIVDQDIPYALLRRYGLRAGFTVGWMF